MNKKITFSIPISKVDEEQRIVYGVATAEVLDKQNEIVDYEASKQAFSDWKGNIREMHKPDSAIGKAVDIQFDDDNKAVVIGAYISKSPDGENALTKVKEGILTGFSIGGRVFETVGEVAKSDDGKDVSAKRIKSYQLAETSLVDVPACPVAEFVMVKSADGKTDELEMTEKMIEHPAPTPVLGWQKAFIYSIDQFNSMQKAAKEQEKVEVKEFEKRDLTKKDYSDKEREQMADSGEALPDGSFPIKNKSDLENAIKAVGRAKDQDKAKAHIKKRAKALGETDLIPDTWKAVKADDLEKNGVLNGANRDHLGVPEKERQAQGDKKDEQPETPQGTQTEPSDEGKDSKSVEGQASPAPQAPSQPEGEKPVEPAAPAAAPETPAAPAEPATPAPAPEAAADPQKADKTTELRKDLYTVGSLADCLSCLVSIRDWCTMEAEWEGDGSTVPAKLTSAIEELGGILTEMTQEEVAEAAKTKGDDDTLLLADKGSDLEKLQATIEKSTKSAIDNAAELIFGKVAEVVKPLADRVAQLEHQPAAGNRPVPTFEVEKSVGAPVNPEAAASAGEQADLQKRWNELKEISAARKNDPSLTLGERQKLVDEMWTINKKLNGVTTDRLNPGLVATYPQAFHKS